MTNKNGGINVITSMMFIALTVLLVASVSLITAQIASDINSDFNRPAVDVTTENERVDVRLLDKNGADEVRIITPNDSNIPNQTVETVGRSIDVDLDQIEKGEVRIVSVKDGSTTLLDSITIEDDSPDGDLIVVRGSGEGDSDGFSYNIENRQSTNVRITHFAVRSVNSDDLRINTNTPPSDQAQTTKNEITILSESDGWCGRQKPKEIIQDRRLNLEKFCKSGSTSSITGNDSISEVIINGVQTSDNTEYIGIIDDPELVDLEIEFFSNNTTSVIAPVALDTFVVPDEKGGIYASDIDQSTFDKEEPDIVVVREQGVVDGEIDGENLNEINIKLKNSSRVEDSIENVNQIIGENKVTVIGSIDGRSDSNTRVDLGNKAQLDDIYRPTSVRIGDESTVQQIKNAQGQVVIGNKSTIDSIIGGDGDVTIGSSSTIYNDIKEVDETVEIGSDSSIPSEISGIGGDLILNDGVTVSEVSDISGTVICYGDVNIESGNCDKYNV